MDYIKIFFQNFWQALMPLVPNKSPEHPYATGNMASGISYIETENSIEVNMVAIDNGEDYVGDVNESFLAKKRGRARTPLEEQNYHFIQRAINQASLLTADTVEWDGGGEFEIY